MDKHPPRKLRVIGITGIDTTSGTKQSPHGMYDVNTWPVITGNRKEKGLSI